MNEKHFEREKIVLRPTSENNMGYNNRPELEVNTVLLEEPAAKPGLIKRGIGYAKENPIKSTLMVAGAAAAAYGAYEGGKWIVNKAKGFFGKKAEEVCDLEETEVEVVEEKKHKKEKK